MPLKSDTLDLALVYIATVVGAMVTSYQDWTEKPNRTSALMFCLSPIWPLLLLVPVFKAAPKFAKSLPKIFRDAFKL